MTSHERDFDRLARAWIELGPTVAPDRSIAAALQASGIGVSEAEVTRLPTMSIPLEEATARAVLRLIDALEELDDVQAVYANFDISDEIMAAVAG